MYTRSRSSKSEEFHIISSFILSLKLFHEIFKWILFHFFLPPSFNLSLSLSPSLSLSFSQKNGLPSIMSDLAQARSDRWRETNFFPNLWFSGLFEQEGTVENEGGWEEGKEWEGKKSEQENTEGKITVPMDQIIEMGKKKNQKSVIYFLQRSSRTSYNGKNNEHESHSLSLESSFVKQFSLFLLRFSLSSNLSPRSERILLPLQ